MVEFDHKFGRRHAETVMNFEAFGPQLHDRATRCQPLTSEEADAQLAWIAQQVRRLDKENAALRRENARLRAQSADQSARQPA